MCIRDSDKAVLGYGLKFTKHHTAVLPLPDTGGRIHGLQFLRTAAQVKEGGRPTKEFWPAGVAKKGHFHLLGHQPHWIVLVAEGYATAASIHAATGYPVAVSYTHLDVYKRQEQELWRPHPVSAATSEVVAGPSARMLRTCAALLPGRTAIILVS